MEDVREVPISDEEYDRAYENYLVYWKHTRNVERALLNLIRARSMLGQDSDVLHVRPHADEELEKELQAKPKTREEFIEWYKQHQSFIRRNQE